MEEKIRPKVKALQLETATQQKKYNLELIED